RAKVDLAGYADLRRLHALLSGPLPSTAEPELVTSERLELGLLERNYAAARQALAAHALPNFNWAGYVTPREWYEGLIAQGSGDRAAAQAAFEAAHRLVASIVAERPDDAKAHIVQAEIEARLGRKADAIRSGERALSLRPVAKDAVDGVHITGRLAGVYAQVGEIPRGLELLASAASMPNGPNYGSLKLDETWDPLRQEAWFAAIVATLAPR
ncbi:MAG TPA: hypothetical protein VK993_11490, partial [Chthoniobacterales bacterium]|nr:hypothetical protein [Chthoniobacterales bacterium]